MVPLLFVRLSQSSPGRTRRPQCEPDQSVCRVTSDTPTVRRSPRNPSGNQPLTRPVPPSRRALTSTPGDGRANCGSEPVAAAELGADKVAVFAKGLAQRGDLNLQVLLRDNDAWPHTAHKLVFGDQRSVGLQQDQEEIEGARPQLYRHAVGDQLPAGAAARGNDRIRASRRLLPGSTNLGDAAAGFRGRGRARRRYSSSSWALRLVYGLQFGAALRAGRVNGCEIVLRVLCGLLRAAAATPIRKGQPFGSDACHVAKFVALYELGAWEDGSPWMTKPSSSDRSG